MPFSEDTWVRQVPLSGKEDNKDLMAQLFTTSTFELTVSTVEKDSGYIACLFLYPRRPFLSSSGGRTHTAKQTAETGHMGCTKGSNWTHDACFFSVHWPVALQLNRSYFNSSPDAL